MVEPTDAVRRLILIEGGKGGHDGGMPPDDLAPRVTALEAGLGSLDRKVEKLGEKVDGLVKDVAEIKGKISQMPTTWQMATWFVGVSMGLVALVFTIARAVN